MTARAQIIPVFVPHFGCPHCCVFCNQRKISGSLSSPDGEAVTKIIEEGLSAIHEKINIQLAFYGGSFTAIPAEKQDELLGAALPFLRSGQISSIRLSTRPDAIDEEALDRLESFGVKTIELGTQSLCDSVLESSGRGHTGEQTRLAARQIKMRGFELVLQMMTGLPGDTKEKTIYTAEQIISLAPDGVRIYPTVIIENTPLFDMWKDGSYKEHTVEEAVDWCASILPLFEKALIPVIRLGLNPSEELSHGGAVAGAYHPAFGELVRSRILLKKARDILSNAKSLKTAVLGVNRSDVSAMTGQHRQNINKLISEFNLESLKVRECDVPRSSIVLL